MDGQKRNPCTKKAAIKAIHKKAEALGIDPVDVLDGAAALLGGKVADSDFLGVLLAGPNAPTSTSRMMPNGTMMMVPTKPVADEPAEAQSETEEEPVEPAQDDEPVRLHSEEFAETEFAKENEASWDNVVKKDRKTRENSKQARMIEMLRRPEGATIEQISDEMAWQKHTVRGAISGALRKKLGLNITSGKIDGKRTYRIED